MPPTDPAPPASFESPVNPLKYRDRWLWLCLNFSCFIELVEADELVASSNFGAGLVLVRDVVVVEVPCEQRHAKVWELERAPVDVAVGVSRL